jgi:ATP:corrinoid adenosyltransferase
MDRTPGNGWRDGCVHVYTGDGKGKTTAALGLALRAAGAGFDVYFVPTW